MTELHLYRVYNVETGHQFRTAATPEKAREFRVDGYEIEDLGPTNRSADYEVEALKDRLRRETEWHTAVAETMQRTYTALQKWAKDITENKKRLKDKSKPPISEDDIIEIMRDIDRLKDGDPGENGNAKDSSTP